jgi:inner membrane protein
MQKTLSIKLFIIAGLCIIFAIGLNMVSSVIYERQNYADSVVIEIAQQHVNPQEIITPFITIPTTVMPECTIDTKDKAIKCPSSYSKLETIFATQTQATQNLEVSTDTYQRGIYHATSYRGDVKFDQSYLLKEHFLTEPLSNQVTSSLNESDNTSIVAANTEKTSENTVGSTAKKTVTHWNEAKLIIPVSDLRGVATLPTVTIDQQQIKATYPQTAMLRDLTYVEVSLPQHILTRLNSQSSDPSHLQTSNQNNKPVEIMVNLPLSGISNLNTVPTGQNFELTMNSNWHAPNFIGKALPNAKSFTSDGFEANWQNQYLTIANNQRLSQCLSTPNSQCNVISKASLNTGSYPSELEADGYPYASEAAVAVEEASDAASNGSIRLNSFGVSFAEPNDVYLQTERTMKYALLLILVSFGTFFSFEVIKSSRIHPIQYLLVGCALLVFYVLLLPLAEQIVFWKAYAIAATACVGLIGWYTYYVPSGVKRAAIFTTILAGLYASFYGILTIEDMNLLLGAVFCFALIASVMVMTRKIDWYQVT